MNKPEHWRPEMDTWTQQQHIDWYNSQPSRKPGSKDYGRTECPFCGIPPHAIMGPDELMVVTLDHKPSCRFFHLNIKDGGVDQNEC